MKSWEEDEIRKLARAIWRRQGCPEGRALEHWWEAEGIFLGQRKGLDHHVRDLRARGSGT